MKLRPYQSESVQAIYHHFGAKTTNPLITLPTGAGKSIVIAFVNRNIQENIHLILTKFGQIVHNHNQSKSVVIDILLQSTAWYTGVTATSAPVCTWMGDRIGMSISVDSSLDET